MSTVVINGRRTRSGGRDRVSTHGMSNTKIYNIWADMLYRCTRPAHARYADYGGRGITVCERWHDFGNFYADMGDRPEGRSLDRRDNEAGYSPENCRWATLVEQMNNRRPYKRNTRCGKGHPYSGKLSARGKQRCLVCERACAARARARKASAK